ncbi:ATP synthase subunit alpha [Trifolium pratense]|uniref:ATP synthase subunit alpha n=1 Tax=Trifolium pratense TaxID=57577 RepID=A0A2K3NMM9_TRIPR|nr:ATP synthase subunit alpha [Trifolium pratense]
MAKFEIYKPKSNVSAPALYGVLAFAHPFSCSLAAIKKQRTLESASNSKGAGSLLTDSTATCWHSISSGGASLGSSAHFSKDRPASTRLEGMRN